MPCRDGVAWTSRFIIAPESPFLRVQHALMHYCAIYNFLMVPMEICSVQVQQSYIIMMINAVSTLCPNRS